MQTHGSSALFLNIWPTVRGICSCKENVVNSGVQVVKCAKSTQRAEAFWWMLCYNFTLKAVNYYYKLSQPCFASFIFTAAQKRLRHHYGLTTNCVPFTWEIIPPISHPHWQFIHRANCIYTAANTFMINSCRLNIKKCQTVQLIIQLMIQWMMSSGEAFTQPAGHRWYSISV